MQTQLINNTGLHFDSNCNSENSSDISEGSGKSPAALSGISDDDASSSHTSNSFTDSSESQAPEFSPITRPTMTTFKLVGDNIDKTVKPRHEMSQDHTKSLHYFDSFAVLDRHAVSHLEDTSSLPDTDNIDTNILIPTKEDNDAIIENMTILMGRVIQKHCVFF
jgi:L1 cell adhesion molecule like protein